MGLGSTFSSSQSSEFLTFSSHSIPDASSKHELWNSLDVFQKSLLSTDGTLTIMLSAFLGEEISLTDVEQNIFKTSVSHQFLEAIPNENILQRRVILSTSKSCRKLVYCESEIAIDRLDHEIKHRLLEDEESIGRILRTAEAETFRKPLNWGVHKVKKNEEIVKHFDDEIMLYRTYAIVIKKRPSMVITEYFSKHLFGSERLRERHFESAQ